MSRMTRHLDRELIEGFESISDAARETALVHLRGCAGCRAAWIADEPSRVFALLSRAPVPEQRLELLSQRVAAAVAPRERTPRWYGAASIAASLLLAAVLGAVLWSHELPQQSIARIEEIGSPGRMPLEDIGARLVALPGEESRVLDLTIGETQVLLIFDESIEL